MKDNYFDDDDDDDDDDDNDNFVCVCAGQQVENVCGAGWG
jgi:hypothetical protein